MPSIRPAAFCGSRYDPNAVRHLMVHERQHVEGTGTQVPRFDRGLGLNRGQWRCSRVGYIVVTGWQPQPLRHFLVFNPLVLRLSALTSRSNPYRNPSRFLPKIPLLGPVKQSRGVAQAFMTPGAVPASPRTLFQLPTCLENNCALYCCACESPSAQSFAPSRNRDSRRGAQRR